MNEMSPLVAARLKKLGMTPEDDSENFHLMFFETKAHRDLTKTFLWFSGVSRFSIGSCANPYRESEEKWGHRVPKTVFYIRSSSEFGRLQEAFSRAEYVVQEIEKGNGDEMLRIWGIEESPNKGAHTLDGVDETERREDSKQRDSAIKQLIKAHKLALKQVETH